MIAPATPHLPVAWGEVFDKLSILEIKLERLSDPGALANVRREAASLAAVAAPVIQAEPAMISYRDRLHGVNSALWDVEDALREMEAAGRFGERFVALARSVYHHNDERAAIKREINMLLRSEIVEEKSYRSY